MSGPGDIDGEVSGDEAAWRDLIARFDVPADPAITDVPWPAREDLPDRVTSAAEPGPGPAEKTAHSDSAPTAAEPSASGTEPGVAADPPPSTPVKSFYIPVDRMRVIRPAGDPRSYTP